MSQIWGLLASISWLPPLTYPPPPRNKDLTRPFEGKPTVNKPSIRPYFWRGSTLGEGRIPKCHLLRLPNFSPHPRHETPAKASTQRRANINLSERTSGVMLGHEKIVVLLSRNNKLAFFRNAAKLRLCILFWPFFGKKSC